MIDCFATKTDGWFAFCLKSLVGEIDSESINNAYQPVRF